MRQKTERSSLLPLGMPISDLKEENISNGSTILSRSEKLIFFLMSITCFLGYITSVQLLAPIKRVIFPSFGYPFAAQSALGYGQIIVIMFLLLFGHKLNPIKTVTISHIALIFLSLVLPLITILGADRKVFYYLQLSALVAQQAVVGYSLTGVFSLSSLLHPDLSGFASVGIPISGLIAFLASILLNFFLTEYSLILTMYSFPLFSAIVTWYLYKSLLRTPWIQNKLIQLQEEALRPTDGDTEGKKLSSFNSSLQVLRAAYQPILSIWLCMLVLFTIYPAYVTSIRSKPESFGLVIVGIHTLGESIGRYVVTFGLALPRRFLIPAGVLRISFIIIFGAAATLDDSSWLKNPWCLYAIMTIQGLTFGWLIGSGFVDAPNCVESLNEKRLIGVLGTAFCNLGIPCGTAVLYILTSLHWLKMPEECI